MLKCGQTRLAPTLAVVGMWKRKTCDRRATKAQTGAVFVLKRETHIRTPDVARRTSSFEVPFNGGARYCEDWRSCSAGQGAP